MDVSTAVWAGVGCICICAVYSILKRAFLLLSAPQVPKAVPAYQDNDGYQVRPHRSSSLLDVF